MKKIFTDNNEDLKISYGSGFPEDWEVIEPEEGKFITIQGTGKLENGEEVYIKYKPFDNCEEIEDLENCTDWNKYWVFDEDMNLIGTEEDFVI